MIILNELFPFVTAIKNNKTYPSFYSINNKHFTSEFTYLGSIPNTNVFRLARSIVKIILCEVEMKLE
jgi:hypothetical protein